MTRANRLAAFLVFAPIFVAADASTDQLKLTTERLVVFKDGYGLVARKGTAVADADGRAFTADVPDAAVLGCFWATADDGHRILAMRAEWDERKATRSLDTPCLTIAELLRSNVGKQVTLELTDKTEKGVSLTQDGKLIELLDLPADSTLPPAAHPAAPLAARYAGDAAGTISPAAYTTLITHEGVVTYGTFTPDVIANGGTLVRELPPRGGELLVIDRDGLRTVLPVSHVQAVVGKDLATRLGRREETYSKTKRLTVDFGKEAAGKPVAVHLFYFTPGLRWIPTYRVSGELKDKADVALQGEILNDVTDVEHADLELVVGVPNFRFKADPSPLTLERTMRSLMISDGRVNLGNNSMVQSQFSNGYGSGARGGQPGGAGEDMTMAPELTGAAGEQDLFVYSVKDFTLRKGARATMPLWQTPVPLRHLYTYDIKAKRNRASGGVTLDANPGSPLHVQMNEVWHQLELTNASKIPWTTGAALTLREMLPLGQDLLTYTPPSGKALLPVTVAVDLRGTYDEQETGRTPNAAHFDGTAYTLIKKKGTVTLTSFRKDKSDVRVTLATGGSVTAASDDGKIKLNDFRADDWDDAGYRHSNNHADVTWEFNVDPGQTKTLTYDVEFYVH